MTALWTSDAAAEATGGTLQGPAWAAQGVSIDTRTLTPGDLFVALTDQRDGHDFVADALVKGAAAALVSRVPEGVPDDAPLLVMPDVLEGLEALGRAGRARTKAKVIGITGSAGKTSTKEMLRHVLERQGKTHAAEASYNNHWGVPLTLARMPEDTDYAVVEIGMNRPGEIAPLSSLARPHIAIVTTVAAAHLEAFENIEGIAAEKASIFEGLEPEGAALFNADIETAGVLADTAQRYASDRIGFGALPGAQLHAASISLQETASVVKGSFRGQPFLFKIGAPGRHFAMNALAVWGAAILAGADMGLAAVDLGQWHPPAGRGSREMLALDPVEEWTIELMDDAFNANPASMGAAFWVLKAIPTKDGVGRIAKGRRIAILGDMLELGPTENELHANLADHPAMRSIDRVDCVGPRMRALYDALPERRRGRWTETAEDMAAVAHQLVDAGDVVLVKGSKGSRVSLVVEALRRIATARARGREKERS
ncbi:MAG: UDP-N-acetylmuramoyl-tripeptide--D-alanyl-D-alanine ligase [Paracoccaceae bacterium]|nr:UDP-N-acetylmuramoyl-tripeptide--D-alanyl-D-alanine ligase [Paracoccaceae bacterium]